ncbi:MAG: archease, partial [Thermodesulfovibrionales bacterium]|nr:archease [Thermodesulfovibrionales bacterium]
MKQFEIIDISGDVGIRAFGKSIEEAFKNSAIGMYSLITDLDDVKGEKSISISVESNSLEGLLVSWLNELIFHFDAYN